MTVNIRAVYAFAREMYPKKSQDILSYGTAGFRGKAESLESCMFRMGLLATLRSRFHSGSVIGVMITASHNPEPDNGVKLIDTDGEMLDKEWENYATNLANVDDNELQNEVQKIADACNIDMCSSSQVYVGMDNRYHSPQLLKAVEHGIISLKGSMKSFGIVTTPMMHYFVATANQKGLLKEATEDGYYSKLTKPFVKIMKMTTAAGNYNNKIVFDGANGVGAFKLSQLLKKMEPVLDVTIVNGGNGKINENCGADFVKIHQKAPCNMSDVASFARCVSVDGDADRIVYYFFDEEKQLRLLDGDRIASLVAEFLKEVVADCKIPVKLGIVQTAYANGASTDYMKDVLGLPVECVPTGVKHLHEKAKQFDIGVYFEANGHGTVLFSENLKTLINTNTADDKVELLKNIIGLTNEYVGDSISDMLLVESILKVKGWDVKDWISKYEDLPNIQLKVKVKDRNVIQTTDAERKCTKPDGIQDEMDKIIANYGRGRAFIRPSGTEDFVRVYAEASNVKDAHELAYKIADLTFNMCDGIGELPSNSQTH